ncbi:hypothetical protein SAMN05880501_105275 [Ureibacillus xyleni]|uniref:Uncharacterized protein n=1 Tax=Ureibacillus xyleni TaxID=614648 RepID=A0A285SP61_9BACL|nr:hypothetical protein [Ureibacillus xyleni]SOC09586.1 hypothetical protein SAMN05880501_105275 [Ureibacillus xyleni]
MIRKLLLTITVVFLVTLFVFPEKNSLVSVFRMTEDPIIISKGHYGQSLVLEISFSHEGLEEWLQSANKPYPLLMLDADWIDRSPKLVEIIKKRNFPTGLLGGEGAENKDKYSINDFSKDLAIYQKHFEYKPLWFMTTDYEFNPELMQVVFKEEVNLLSPSTIYTKNYKTTKGTIVTLPLHEKSKFNFEDVSNLLKSEKFISIEENVFGYSIKTKKMP